MAALPIFVQGSTRTGPHDSSWPLHGFHAWALSISLAPPDFHLKETSVYMRRAHSSRTMQACMYYMHAQGTARAQCKHVCTYACAGHSSRRKSCFSARLLLQQLTNMQLPPYKATWFRKEPAAHKISKFGAFSQEKEQTRPGIGVPEGTWFSLGILTNHDASNHLTIWCFIFRKFVIPRSLDRAR